MPTDTELARKQRWRTPNATRRIDVVTVGVFLFALSLIGMMGWMAITGNRLCCDPDSLVLRLWNSSRGAP